MDCRTTSIETRRSCAGASLVELLIAVTVGSMVLAIMASLQLYAGRSFSTQFNYAELNVQSSRALDRMSQQIRQTSSLTSFSTNALTFANLDGTTLQYTYDSGAGTLTEVQRGATKRLLTGCDSLQFSIYQRSPVSGSFDHYTTTNATSCKLVQVLWKCSRTMFGQKRQTENVTSAQIVIRKNQS
jgi:hypothetical protein